jgi:hypothetical protein
MTSKDFTNWLRGYIAGSNELPLKVKNELTKVLDDIVEDGIKPTMFTYTGTGNRTIAGGSTYTTDIPNTKTI